MFTCLVLICFPLLAIFAISTPFIFHICPVISFTISFVFFVSVRVSTPAGTAGKWTVFFRIRLAKLGNHRFFFFFSWKSWNFIFGPFQWLEYHVKIHGMAGKLCFFCSKGWEKATFSQTLARISTLTQWTPWCVSA